jgi:PTH1 family peptidyl-tRNA hydrolase
LRFRDFIRIRLGIGRPPEGVMPDQFVLQNFSTDETKVLEHLVSTGISALHLLVVHGVEHCKNIIHSVRSPSDLVSETS